MDGRNEAVKHRRHVQSDSQSGALRTQIIANGDWHEESDEEKDEDDEEINVAPEGKAVESVVDSRQIAAENGGRDARQIQPQPLLTHFFAVAVERVKAD